LPRNLGEGIHPEGIHENRGFAPVRQQQDQNALQNQRGNGSEAQEIFLAPSQQRQFVHDDFQHREESDLQAGNNMPNYNPEADPQSYRILH
jgi:hypothetical protein